MREMSRQTVDSLIECPDCHGHGTMSTPAKNWFSRVRCARCHGTGTITDYEKQRRDAEKLMRGEAQ